MTALLHSSRGHDETMTRIIGGSAGGRRISTPRGANTRPTSDRVREALFSAIESWCGSLSGLRFLDLYAGSGAVGLEAWSRGAGVVTLVEQDRRTASLIAGNARALGFARAHVVASPVATTLAPAALRALRRGVPRPAVRPSELLGRSPTSPRSATRAGSSRAPWWSSSAGPAAAEPPWPEGFDGSRQKKYGETMLWYVHAAHL